MDIKVINPSEITIYGNITNVVDYQEVKKLMGVILKEGNKEMVINMPDAHSVTSSVIGLLLKTVYQDGVKLTVNVSDRRLMKLFTDLKLTEAFNVVFID